jgi:hypothetical protein
MNPVQFYRSIIIGVASLAGLGCGNSGDSSPRATTGDDVASYRQSVRDVASAATAYRAAMLADEMTTEGACEQVHEQYDARLRWPLASMSLQSGDLDTFMSQHGGDAMADIDCATTGMNSELGQHDSIACHLADLAADQAEAVRHVGVMTAYATHLSGRSDQMMRVFTGGMGSWEPMMSGCEGWHEMMMHR